MRHTAAGALSGGQQQLLAIGRALMAKPQVCFCSTSRRWGLRRFWSTKSSSCLDSQRQRGLTLLLVEQNASAALAIADRGYVLETGRITIAGQGKELLDDPRVRAAYLGV